MDRRKFLGAATASGLVGLAGCSVNLTDDGFEFSASDDSSTSDDSPTPNDSSDGTLAADDKGEDIFSKYSDGTGNGNTGAWSKHTKNGVTFIVGPAEADGKPSESGPTQKADIDDMKRWAEEIHGTPSRDRGAGLPDGIIGNTTTDRRDPRNLAPFTASSSTGPTIGQMGSIRESGAAMDGHCDTEEVTTKAGGSEQMLLNPTQSIFYPGSIIDATTIPTGGYDIVKGNRAPMLLTHNMPGSKFNDGAKRVVEKPGPANVQEAMNSIVRSVKAEPATNANIAYTVEEIFSEQQTTVELGGHYNGAAFDVSGSFDFSDDSTTNKILVKFVQKYYDISVDWQNKAFFTDERTPSPADALVSNVSYGRLLLFSMESSEDVQAMKASVESSFDYGVSEGDAGVDATHDSVMKNATKKVTAIGGNASAAGDVATGGFDAIANYISSGANFGPNNPALPIAYQLTYLSDLSTAGVLLSTDYTRRTCTPVVDPADDQLRVRVYNFSISNPNELPIHGRSTIHADTIWDDGSEVTSDRIFARGRDDSLVWKRNSDITSSYHEPNIDKTLIFTNAKNLVRQDSFIRIEANIEQSGTWSDSDLGTKAQEIYLDSFHLSGPQYKLAFKNDVNLTFMVEVIPTY